MPRQAYLSLYIERIANHFRPFVSGFGSSSNSSSFRAAESEDLTTGAETTASSSSPLSTQSFGDIWFEYDEMPLKWHLPAGVLFDLLFTEHKAARNSDPSNADSTPEDGGLLGTAEATDLHLQRKKGSKYLPWKITVHFSSFPHEQLARLEDETAVQWTCINALKEALFAKLGTTKPIMTLSRPNEMRLWNAIQETNMVEYDKINNLLYEESGNTVRSYPVRILVNQHARSHLPSKLVCAPRTSLQNKSLDDFLLEALPDLFRSSADLQRCNVVIQVRIE